MTRTCTRGVAAVVATAAGLALAGSPAVAAAPTAGTIDGGFASAAACNTTWGSKAKSAGEVTTGRITAFRAGRHTCFDRFVVDTTGPRPGYSVAYVATVYAEGSGLPVPVAGGAAIAVTVRKGVSTRLTTPSVSGFGTFRQVAWAGSFEGHTTVGLGVRARLPMRAFTVKDTATGRYRVVVDVAHRW